MLYDIICSCQRALFYTAIRIDYGCIWNKNGQKSLQFIRWSLHNGNVKAIQTDKIKHTVEMRADLWTKYPRFEVG